MPRRSSRFEELLVKNELSCMWGIFSILESCQGRFGHKVISNMRPASRNAIDYPRQIEAIASFDEECRKFHNGAGLSGSVRVDAKGRNARNCIGENMPVEKHKSKKDVVKRQKYAKMDAELLDRLANIHTRARISSEEVHQSSSSCCLNNAARLMNEQPSTSAELSLNKLTLAAILRAVCAQNQQEESELSEYMRRNNYLGNYDQVDELNIQQIQMRAKALVDQMFIDRKFIQKEGRNLESKSFSEALEALNSKRDLFMELLPDPNSMLARRLKKSNPSQIARDTIKSVLGTNLSECEGIDESTSSKSMHERSMNDKLWKKFDYQLKTAQPTDKIVILKPGPRNGKRFRNITCNCSKLQSPQKSSRRVSEVKTTSFTFREIRKRLKHTFGVTKKELSEGRSTPGVGSECIYHGVDMNSSDSSTKAERTGKLSKKQELKSNRGSDIACVTDTTRQKLYVSGAGSSNKQECDVILEAKRHLSKRFSNLNSVEAVTGKKSPRTLERILSSPEHDFWPFSPRRDSLYVSGSAEMRYSPYNASSRVMESNSHVRNELRSNTEVTSCDDHDRSLQTVDAKAYLEADTNISTTENMKTDGESEIAETDNFLQPELHASGQVLCETTSFSINKPMETTDTMKAQKCNGIVMHSVLDSLTENEAVTSALDDFPSTPSSNHQLVTAESIKFQEEHQSPVSVLENFFVEEADTPPRMTLQTGQFSGRKQLQPHRLDFEECSCESFPQYPPASSHSCMDEELCQYVQLVLEASCLNWDQLSEITCPPEELLHESLFDEVELPPLDCYYDPKLLFDHINEVLLEIYKCHFCSPPWLATALPKTKSLPLADVVLDEILAEAEFFLLPTTDKRTLDELVSKEVAKCRSWLDVRLDTEHIAIEVSEAVLEESLLDTLLEFSYSYMTP